MLITAVGQRNKKNQPYKQQLKTIVCIEIWFEVFLLGSHISLAKAIYYKLM